MRMLLNSIHPLVSLCEAYSPRSVERRVSGNRGKFDEGAGWNRHRSPGTTRSFICDL